MLIESRQVILAVKEHPCLYDQNCEDFSNRIRKINAWMEVTETVLGDKFHQVDEEARNQICADVQKRWRHLRDSYVKASKLKKSKPYVFSKEMSFIELWPERSKKLKITEEANSPQDPCVPKSADSQYQKPQVRTPAVTSGSCLPQDTLHARKGKKPGAITEFENMLMNVVKTNLDHAPSSPDPDEMFFLSQMPQIKALSPSDLIDFKFKFMELVKSYTTFYD